MGASIVALIALRGRDVDWVQQEGRRTVRQAAKTVLAGHVMLRVPESCPWIALRAETGMTGMKHRIWQMKLMLLRRIQKQNTLCREVAGIVKRGDGYLH